MLETECINTVQLGDYAAALKQSLTRGASRPRKEVEAAVANIYKNIGLDAPTMVWCRSPQQMRLMIQLLRILITQQSRKPEGDAMAALRKATKKHHNEEAYKELLLAFEQQINFVATCPSSFGQSIHAKLTNHLMRNLSPALSNSFDNKFNSQSRIQIESFLRKTVHNHLQTIKDFFVANYYFRSGKYGSIETTLSTIQKHLNDTEEPSDGNSIQNKTDYFDNWGAWDFYWIAAYEFAQSTLQLKLSIDTRETDSTKAELTNWLQVLDGAAAYQLFENFAFICQYPNSVELDDNGRFHNSVGPALSFSDSDKYFAWHGCLVPDWVIEKRHSICPAFIDKQNNVELRRVMIDMYGWERYLKNSRLEKLHEDKYGILYCKDLGGRPWHSIFVVEVVNATPEPNGKRRRYLLRVPPHMKTAREAVAWTFGMTEDTYKPEFES
ncbi:hypothetical protein BH11CYA1_BH11CYA1_06110 [soil metagenome]